VGLQIKRILLPGGNDDDALIAATIVAECASAPQLDPP
jgi:ADP-heptose:LPS heptosyltransferase